VRPPEREIFFSYTERENKTAEGKREKFFLLSFLSFSLFFLQIKEAFKIHRVAQKVWL